MKYKLLRETLYFIGALVFTYLILSIVNWSLNPGEYGKFWRLVGAGAFIILTDSYVDIVKMNLRFRKKKQRKNG